MFRIMRSFRMGHDSLLSSCARQRAHVKRALSRLTLRKARPAAEGWDARGVLRDHPLQSCNRRGCSRKWSP